MWIGGWIKSAWEIDNNIEVTGIDGHYIKDILDFDEANILYKNLEEEVRVNKHDLAISVETAEHLSPGRAKTFVRDLCNASDVIFSAAVDGHGGANHLNEQTQSYWIKIFEENKFDPFIFLDRKNIGFIKLLINVLITYLVVFCISKEVQNNMRYLKNLEFRRLCARHCSSIYS